MKIDREQWLRLSGLLDEALDMDASEHDLWLERLSGDAAVHRDRLRALLLHAKVNTSDFVITPDSIAAIAAASAQHQARVSSLQPEGVVGGYRLLREIGMGGMASVWLAERIDGRLQRQVALKFPYAGPQQRQLAERLARERDILARLEHPNIARLYDAEVTDLGQPFLVLEYVDGIPIQEYCDQQRLPIRERLVLFLQVLSAVQYAHAHLVIHRDLKPSNILVTHDRVARLLDFGIAKLLFDGETRETALTQLGGRALTPDFASPEQICGQPITTASDVYSLGVLLYELLTGARPYKLRFDRRSALEDAIAEADIIAPSRAAVTASVAEARASSLRKLTQDLRGDLDAIVHKALRKKPEERYASVDALTQDIKHWLDGEMVEAQPPSTWYGVRKLVKRNRTLFAAMAAVFLSLIAGAALAIWQARSAMEQALRLQATKGFLVDIFNANSSEQPDPLKAQQTSARELLDRAAERLTGQSQSQSSPYVSEEVLGILGGLYQDLGLDEKSAVLRGRRVAILQKIYGANDERVAEAEVAYANSLYATDDWQQALAPLQDAERILDRRGDETSIVRARQLEVMAQYLRGIDRGRAREYAARGIALDRQKFPRSPEFIEMLRVAALLDSETGNRRAAIPLLEEALAVQASTGAAEVNLIKPLVELAELQAQDSNNLTAAEENFQRGLAISRRLNGEVHIDTVQASLRYGKFLRNRGRLTESEALLRGAAANAVQLLGDDETFHVPTVREELAETEQALGNFSVADELYRKAIAARETKRSGNRQHAVMLMNRASLLIDMGRPDESLWLLAKAVDYFERSAVPVGTTEAPVILSAALSAAGRQQDALDALDRYAGGVAALSPAMQVEFELRRAGALAELGDAGNAESILRLQLRLLSEQPRHDEKRLLQAQAQIQLGRLLLKREATGEAREMLQTALDSRTADLSPVSPLLAEAQAVMAECLTMLGDLREARSLVRKAQAIVDANPALSDKYRLPLRTLSLRMAQLAPLKSR